MTALTPNTFVVGAGPVATAVAGALRLGGVPVLGLWARRPAAARAAGAVSGVASFSAAPPDLLLEADAVVLAVRDDAIEAVARTLVATGLISKRHVLLHCSGALSAEEAFASVRDSVGGVGTLHPLRAITDGRTAMREFAGTVFGVEGDERGRHVARALVAAVQGTALELSGGQMAAYHAAAAMASNYVVALLGVAAHMLEASGISQEDAVKALLPLCTGALENVRTSGLVGGLTGPIRRGDQATIARHLDAIPANVAPLYRALGLETLAIARRAADAQPDDLAAIERLLDPASEGHSRAANN
jgi:predicted short-subunit dehydrogenase-like oxidoreductase (DUF2520 family)